MQLKIIRLLEKEDSVQDVAQEFFWQSIRIDTHVENVVIPNSKIKNNF